MYFIGTATLYLIGMFVVIIYTTIAIFYTLKKTKSNFAPTIANLHRQINWILVTQVKLYFFTF